MQKNRDFQRLGGDAVCLPEKSLTLIARDLTSGKSVNIYDVQIPQCCPCSELVWRRFLRRKSGFALAGNRVGKLIPVDLVGQLLALDLCLDGARPSLGYGRDRDGRLFELDEIRKLTRRARRLAVDIISGELIDFSGSPVDAYEYFPTVGWGDVSPVPAHIASMREELQEKQAQRKEARDQRRTRRGRHRRSS